MLCPADAVVEHLLVFQELIHFDIARVIGSVVPERAHFGRVVGLPVGVCFPDHVFHFICRPLLGLKCHDGQYSDDDKKSPHVFVVFVF